LNRTRARPGAHASLRRYRCALLRGRQRASRWAAEHERSCPVCSRAGIRPGGHRRSVAATARRGVARRGAGCIHHGDSYCCQCRSRDARPGVGLFRGSVAAARRRSPSRGTKTARQEPYDGPRGQGADAGARSVGGTRSGVRVSGDGSGPATRRGAGGASPGPTYRAAAPEGAWTVPSRRTRARHSSSAERSARVDRGEAGAEVRSVLWPRIRSRIVRPEMLEAVTP